MPGSLSTNLREGNRSEYLAQYFLSALGISVIIPRQEDIGVDFHCALFREAGPQLTFHSPFLVQVGCAGNKIFKYGGYKDGTWQKQQLDWLFTQELPFFVCLVDKKELSFRLYSASPMWLVLYQYGNVVSELQLVPDATHHPITECQEKVPEFLGKEGDDGCRYRVPLGRPIVDLRVADLMTDVRDSAVTSLEKAVMVEMSNITYRRLGAHFVRHLANVSPNDKNPVVQEGHFYFWNDEPGRNTQQQLKALVPILVALAVNFKAQQKSDELFKLKDVFSLIPKELILTSVAQIIPEVL
jgi:hypothetical protein